MADELTELPESFIAGTTVRYRRTYADYPASDDWTLKLHLAGRKVIHVTASEDGDDFIVLIKPGDTDTELEGGLYRWAEMVEKGSGADLEVYALESGTVTVQPNFATATDGQLQSWREKMVELLQQYISGRLPAGLESYVIAGRQIQKYSITEADELLRKYEGELSQQRNPGPFAGTVLGRFTGTGYTQ